MFYPIDSLKRGGRFYLCWVADSWPLRFATITHRQLWSQDIRKICDELIEVMTNESGRPTNRYSLRLSSQLMRGLVRLYQRKVTVFLSDLCMINVNVIRHVNKKFNVHEILDLPHRERPRPLVLELPQTVILEPENDPRIEELIQNSGNVVSNIQDITLREAAIPEFLLPPNDGFGEENPDQVLQLLGDRTVEMMMMPADASSAQHSGLDLGLNQTDKSHDKSRLVPQEIQMERLSEHDVTLFRRSDGESLMPVADFEKDIPEIPDVPIPELPVREKKQGSALEIPEVPVEPPEDIIPVSTAKESEQFELEELEETEPPAKRGRYRRRLIIDKTIKISPSVLRARIQNPNVELRCEDSTDDIIDIRVPYEVLMRRPCHAGHGDRSNLSDVLTIMFMRNLGVVNKPTLAERELEEGAMARSLRFQTRSMLDRIEEAEEPTTAQERAQPQPEPVLETTMNQDNLAPQLDFSKDCANVTEGYKEEDIADMLTQKIETLSQKAKKRATGDIEGPTPKKQRSIGYVSFRESQQKKMEKETTVPDILVTESEKHHEIPEFEIEVDKENVPDNKQISKRTEADKSVTAMLQEAGLADIPPHQPMESERPVSSQKPVRKQASEGSETPLGSLDRTKVSLGDSENTTDSKRFIRDQWGTEGTMIKILRMIKESKRAVTVGNLIAKGPVLSGYKAIIAARCFTSILKLKQNDFIKIKKCPDTLEVEDIVLGLKFYL